VTAGVTKVIGHRGAPRLARENTVAAFEAAAAVGADMVELDARRTADGALVVHHDAALADGRVIVESRARELPDWLPDLRTALAACDGMDVNVEIKNTPIDPDFDVDDRVALAVVDLVAELDLADRVIVSSFNPRTIEVSRAADPGVPTALLVSPGFDPAAFIDVTASAGHAGLHPHDIDVTAELVQRAHAAGLVVNVWTVDDLDRIKQLADWGVDGICTNVPDLAVGVLKR
jgi:glycerophosphoryl diester phosphodiesterase